MDPPLTPDVMWKPSAPVVLSPLPRYASRPWQAGVVDAQDASQPRVEVRRSTRRRRTVTAYRSQDTIVVLIPQRMSKADEQATVANLVRRVLAQEARQAAPISDQGLAERARVLAESWLTSPSGQIPEAREIRWVTNQNQRWGSCTPSTGGIRLSAPAAGDAQLGGRLRLGPRAGAPGRAHPLRSVLAAGRPVSAGRPSPGLSGRLPRRPAAP